MTHLQLGTPVVWCWDNLNVHLVKELKDFATAHKDWLRIYQMPSFTSHGALVFSRCTGFPFSQDVSAIYPLGDRRYAVHHRGEPFSREPRYTAQEAAAVIVARMPETWGPAVAGTQHDLRERESQ